MWHTEKSLKGYDMVVLPGGFSYGDYLRAGAIARFSPVMGAVEEHVKRGGLVLGICNGFQILTEAHLLPGALIHNDSMKFICKDTFIKVENTGSFVTRGAEKGKVLRVPIAHMEGRYTAPEDTLKELEDNGRILFRYCERDGTVTPSANPNGSARNIAGILSAKGNVAGMMPHPERVCEPELGGVDGLAVFESVLNTLSAA